MTTDGTPCNELVVPPKQCAIGEDISTLVFSYQNCVCSASSNGQPNPNIDGEEICMDFAPLVESDILVECVDASGVSMSIEPTTVAPGAVFSVTNPSGGPLPEKIYCDLSDAATGEKLQTNIIDTSGTTDLQIGDKYGAMTLEACDEKSCIETLCYNIAIANTGGVCMDVTVADFIFNGELIDVLPLLPITEICPGESESIEQKGTVNICEGTEFCAEVIVEADPPNGDMCQDEDEYKFTPPVTPTNAPVPGKKYIPG